MATASALITRAQLERRFGPRTVAQYVDDDGDEQADAATMEDVLESASQCAEGALGHGFGQAQIQKLVDNDAHVRGLICDIAADEMSRRRPEHFDEQGTGPYTAIRKAAELKLKDIGQAKARARGEQQAGPNNVITTKVSVDPPCLQFARTKEHPNGRGGF